MRFRSLSIGPQHFRTSYFAETFAGCQIAGELTDDCLALKVAPLVHRLLAPGEDGQRNCPFVRLNPAWIFPVANGRRG